MRRNWAAGVVTATVLTVAGCVGPTPTFGVYEQKAVTTAAAALSATRTALVVVPLAYDRAFAPSIAIAIIEAQRDVVSAADTFSTIQPPDARSDRLRRELNRVLLRATNLLTDLRIAARREDLAGMRRAAGALVDVADGLDRFVEDRVP
jgi:hypothetical protein